MPGSQSTVGYLRGRRLTIFTMLLRKIAHACVAGTCLLASIYAPDETGWLQEEPLPALVVWVPLTTATQAVTGGGHQFMPMPTGGAWPPPAHAPAYSAYRDWDAWYSGDPDQLRTVYLNRAVNGTNLSPSQRVRAGQYAGGLVGTFSRWLWGNPPPVGSRDARLHCPLPADLTASVANLLFSEPPKISHEDTSVMTRLETLIEDGLNSLLLQAAEANSALGDVYLRPVVDQEVMPGKAFPSVVHADGALPNLRWGRLVDVTFWSELHREGNTVVRLLEHHEVVGKVGRIVYQLHEGTPDQLGRVIPLTEHDGAAYLADLVDADSSQVTGLNRLDVVRVPNAGPQRRWRTTPGLKYLGRSDLDGNEQWFDAVDEAWTSWMRDIRLGRGRLVVPDYMLQSAGRGQGASFDAEREVFTAVNALPDSGTGITISQFDIRVEEHRATIDELTKVAMRHAGLSSQTLGDEGDVAVTATEVQSRERMSFTTRGNRVNTWGPAIAEYIELHLAVERAQLAGKVEPVRPNVEFGDSVSEAPETVARTLQLLHAAEAVSVETRVRMVHPDWDDTQVQQEVARIKDDEPEPVEVGPALGALAGNNPPPGGPEQEGEGEPEE
ncbi:phage capsid protein [Solwaraspora sp. WMMD1047]|uniref:phage capsid protein n=1 Tax=Solwaraspora sp. WMMD1047 TaxID=3016102 RepID=UPI0024177176|nr:phage capsid protein [Solwaraspora sp. WMMD1047]MDG4832417.1 phage capsid protein [Solwaraspora sp. WMMD1047]